ncbi:hypothetical protein [Sorangium sp. So ce341]
MTSLQAPELAEERPDHVKLRARGIVDVLRVQRVQNDKFMNFGMAEVC